MIKAFILGSVLVLAGIKCVAWPDADNILYKADNPFFRYVGRIDFSNKQLPRFWAPGVSISGKFRGTFCEIILRDEVLWGKSHNYVSVVIDGQPARRVKLTDKINHLRFDGLKDSAHTVVVCKDTESGIGYLEFEGLKCKELLRWDQRSSRRIEFVGNSITCGTGSDLSLVPCDNGEWYDQHNAYMSYGPLTARSLQADWVLSAVSGIGLVQSCCDMNIVMPQVFDKLNMRENKGVWDFKQYTPDVVTITLGQNDGTQDSAKFVSAYVDFIASIRSKYLSATMLCLTSPMAGNELRVMMENYLTAVTEELNRTGDTNVYSFFYSKSFNDGCGGHPDLRQHQEIAGELTSAIKRIKGW